MLRCEGEIYERRWEWLVRGRKWGIREKQLFSCARSDWRVGCKDGRLIGWVAGLLSRVQPDELEGADAPSGGGGRCCLARAASV